MPADRRQLDYAPPSRWHRGRRARRLAALCAALLVLALGLRWGPLLVHRAQAHYWFGRCMSYAARGDEVAYEAPRRKAGTVHIPRPWLQFYSYWSGAGIPRTSGTLFLHERSTPSGARRLVAVDVVNAGASRDFQVQSNAYAPPVGIAPARLMSTVTSTLWLPADPGQLQIFAGQIDPRNPSHFVLNYAIGDRRGVIDGWLKNDQTVILELRNPLIDATQPTGGP